MIGMLARAARRRAVRVKRQTLSVILTLLATNRPMSSLDLARLVDLTPTAVRVHLDWLAGEGYIRAIPRSPDDQSRIPQYVITITGRHFIDDVIADLLATANMWGGARPDTARGRR